MAVVRKPGKRAVKDTAEKPPEVGQPDITEIVAKQTAKEIIGVMASKNLSIDNAELALSIAQDYIHEYRTIGFKLALCKRGKEPVSGIINFLGK